MVSGVNPTSEHTALFNELKIDRLHKCLIFDLIDKNSKLDCIFTGDKDFQWDSLQELLPKDDCRFVIYDFNYETDENPPRPENKLLAILWAPETAKVKRRVPFSTSFNGLKSAFTGLQKDVQASDWSYLEYKSVR